MYKKLNVYMIKVKDECDISYALKISTTSICNNFLIKVL